MKKEQKKCCFSTSSIPDNIHCTDESYPTKIRIRTRHEYLQLQHRGVKIHTKHFIFLLLYNSARLFPDCRLGITLTKKIGNAVKRNRIRRILKEIFRRNKRSFPQYVDLAIIAKKNAVRLRSSEIYHEIASVNHVFKRVGAPSHNCEAIKNSNSIMHKV